MGKISKLINAKIDKYLPMIWGVMLMILITLALLGCITFFGLWLWAMLGGI